MKAVAMNEYGGPEVLKLTDYPDLNCRSGRSSDMSRSRQHNPIDLLQRREQIKKVRSHPWIAKEVPVRGCIFDVDTGRLREVKV